LRDDWYKLVAEYYTQIEEGGVHDPDLIGWSMRWNPSDRETRQKMVAWSVATETCVQTKEDPVLIYNRILERNKGKDKDCKESIAETN
jgi:hypothetical protein